MTHFLLTASQDDVLLLSLHLSICLYLKMHTLLLSSHGNQKSFNCFPSLPPSHTDPELLRQGEGACLSGDEERALSASSARPGGERLQGRLLRGRVWAGPQSDRVSSLHPRLSHSSGLVVAVTHLIHRAAVTTQ